MQIGISNQNVKWYYQQFSIIFATFFISFGATYWKEFSNPFIVLSGTGIMLFFSLFAGKLMLEKQIKNIGITDELIRIEGTKADQIKIKNIESIIVQKSKSDIVFITFVLKDRKISLSRLIDLNAVYEELSKRPNLKMNIISPKLMLVKNPIVVLTYSLFVSLSFILLMTIAK